MTHLMTPTCKAESRKKIDLEWIKYKIINHLKKYTVQANFDDLNTKIKQDEDNTSRRIDHRTTITYSNFSIPSLQRSNSPHIMNSTRLTCLVSIIEYLPE